MSGDEALRDEKNMKKVVEESSGKKKKKKKKKKKPEDETPEERAGRKARNKERKERERALIKPPKVSPKPAPPKPEDPDCTIYSGLFPDQGATSQTNPLFTGALPTHERADETLLFNKSGFGGNDSDAATHNPSFGNAATLTGSLGHVAGVSGDDKKEKTMGKHLQPFEMEMKRTPIIIDHALSDVPGADAYSTYMATNPWRCCGLGFALIFFLMALGPLVSFTVKDFEVSNEGFESRNTDMAGRIISYEHIANAECKGKLSLYSDGRPSDHYKQYFSYSDNNDDTAYLHADECYDGYATRRRLDSLAPGATQDLLREEGRRVDQHEANRRRVDRTSISTSTSTSISTRTRTEDSRRLTMSSNTVSRAWYWVVARDTRADVALIFTGGDLFQKDPLIGMCTANDKIYYGAANWESNCQKDENGECLPSRMIGNYVAALNNKPSCADISDADVTATQALLVDCRPAYDDGSLVGNCWDWNNNVYIANWGGASFPSCSLSQADQDRGCADYNAVYDIFTALTSTNFLREDSDQKLKVAQVLMGSWQYDDGLIFYDAWHSPVKGMIETSYGGAKFTSVFLGPNLRSTIFFEELYKDLYGIMPCMFMFVFLLIQFHSGSNWIAAAGLIQILGAFGAGFTFYEVFLWRPFFPFLNLMSLPLVMGIGADDIFVYVDAWRQSFTLLPGETPIANRLSWTIKRAGSAMLVTSMTTAVSLVANCVSPITSIKCFGLMAGMVITADFVLMLIFIPCVVLIQYTTFSEAAGYRQMNSEPPQIGRGLYDWNDLKKCNCTSIEDMHERGGGSKLQKSEQLEKLTYYYNDKEQAITDAIDAIWCRNCCCCVVKNYPDHCAVPPAVQDWATGQKRAPQRWSENLWEFQIAPILTHKWGRYLFIGSLIGIAAWLSTMALLLERPTSPYMQLLIASNALEKYEGQYMDKFPMGSGEGGFFPYRFVFGLDAQDNGDGFDPEDRGSMVFQSLDVSQPAAQQWMVDLCNVTASWDKTSESQLNNDGNNKCNMFEFKSWMEWPCSDTDSINRFDLYRYPERTDCCDYPTTAFPFPKATFDTCIAEWGNRMADIADVANSGVWFDSSGNIKVWVVEGNSNVRYTEVYDDSLHWFQDGQQLLSSQVPNAPKGSGLSHGYFTTEMSFLSLQKSITEGAVASAQLSIFLALAVLALMTRRLFTATFAAVQIFLVVSCCIGCMVLMGWDLGIIESLIFSVAVGLSCDYAAHLAHAFVKQERNTTLKRALPRSFEELDEHMDDSCRRAVAAMTELGVTISLGYVTSFVPGVLLLASNTYFMYQFGCFLSQIMTFSFLFSFGLLMPVLATIGWVDELCVVKVEQVLGDWGLMKKQDWDTAEEQRAVAAAVEKRKNGTPE
jgi:hypothetical protein